MDNKEFENYKRIMNNLYDIVIMVHASGDIIYANQAALDFYGYSQEEMNRKTIFEIRCNDNKSLINQQLNRALNDGIEFEAEHQRKDGSIVPVKVRSIFTEDSQNEYVISIIYDRTKYKQLKEKAKMFDISLDIAEEPIAVSDTSFRITIWNRAAEKRFGFQREDLVGNSVEELVPDDKVEELKVIRELLKMGKVIDRIETVRKHKDGRFVEVSVAYAPLYNEASEIDGFMAIYSDISEVRRLNQEMKAYQERAVLALEGAKFCIWDMDLSNGQLVIYNNLETLLGYREGEIGCDYQKWFELIHPEDVKGISEILKLTDRNRRNFAAEGRIRTKAKGYQWFSIKGQVNSFASDNRPLRVLGTCEDITIHKQIAYELIDKNNELEYLMSETIKANNAKSLFLANMSHEIRTPLNGIISTIQLLKKMEQFTGDQNKLIDILESSSVTLRGIVTDILDISKAEQKEIEVHKERFSLKVMMQEIFNDLQLRANEKGIEAGLLYDSRLQYDFNGDVQKVKQILNNLISNSLKFTEEGKISFIVKLLEEKADQVMVEFEVNDTGIGINNKYLTKIFEAFTQVEAPYEKKYNGAGLGLSISKQFALALGGDVTCQSVEGKGSSFYFLCPLEKVKPDSHGTDEKKASLLQEYRLKPITILSVEDNDINQTIMEYIIDSINCRFIPAYNSEEAMQALETNPIDLILMDIQLPGMNGYQLTEWIRSSSRFHQIPIIAMTAYSQPEDKRKCLCIGMSDFITKPIDVEDLIHRIQRIFSQDSQ